MIRTNGLIVAAHRGYSAHYPENTLLAFYEGIQAGAHMLELDLRLSADGHIVIFHDELLKRTAQVDKPLSELTVEQLKKLEVGSFLNVRFEGLKIPTFEEFCLFIKPYEHILLNIEIKPASSSIDVADKAIEMLQSYDLMERCVFTSFDANVLHHVIDHYRVKTQGFTTEQLKNCDDTIYEKLYAVALRMDEINAENVEKYRAKGLEVWAYCADTEEQVQLAIDHRISLITCNELSHVLPVSKII
ncbi:hypothetical protein MTP04_29470 [Lysinibacillus sp. PLM2]|nr:hypothetical protein MTP04_29470 [Lysinibacillus sp. PLM2]